MFVKKILGLLLKIKILSIEKICGSINEKDTLNLYLIFARKILTFYAITNYDAITKDNKKRLEDLCMGGDDELEKIGKILDINIKNIKFSKKKFFTELKNLREDIKKFIDLRSNRANHEPTQEKTQEPIEEVEPMEEMEEDHNGNSIEETEEVMEQEKTQMELMEASFLETLDEVTTDLNNTSQFEFYKIKYKKKITFNFIPLAKNTLQLYKDYMFKSCHNCDQKLQKVDLTICLFCGWAFCDNDCTESDSSGLMGHSVTYHCGQAPMIQPFRSKLFLSFLVTALDMGSLYKDKYGQIWDENLPKFGTSTLDRFELDEPYVRELERDYLYLNVWDRVFGEMKGDFGDLEQLPL